MKHFLFATFFLSLNSPIWAEVKKITGEPVFAQCLYPAHSINWILAYCGFVSGTDDEIAIQDSECFKKSEVDLKDKNECAVKKKYKMKKCELLIQKRYSNHKSIDECLEDEAVKPYFAGG